MSTRSGRVRASVIESSPPRTRKGVSPPRSPARTRKTSPTLKSSPSTKSSPPARSYRKSPSRKSPSRKPSSKFPARKSPSRATKDSIENASQKSPIKRPPIKTDVSVKLEDLTSKLEIYRSTRSKRIEYSIKDVTSTTDNDITSNNTVNGLGSIDVYGLRNRKSVEDIPPRRSSRLRDFIESVPDIRRSMSKSLSKSVSKSISQSIDTFSDEDNSADEHFVEKSKPVTRKLATPLRGSESKHLLSGSKWEFGGRIGTAALMLLIPLLVFLILISCSKSCSTEALLNLNEYGFPGLWFSKQAFLLVVTQYVLQALLAIIPMFGKKANRLDDTGTVYCFNATFASVITVIFVYLMDYYKVIDIKTLLTDFVSLATVSYVFAVLLSIVLYVKSKKVDNTELNLYGNTGYVLYDFFMGREIHPFMKKLDIKIWISRISNINTLILTTLIFRQGYKLEALEIKDISYHGLQDLPTKLHVQPTILLFSLFQLIYIMNFILKEHRVTTTFFWQSEGVGYLQTVSSALYPFYFTTISKFVVDSQLVLPTNILISASVLYALGFLIMLLSNNVKHEFRNNSLHSSITNLDSMPTFHGNKLLVGNLWGILRHPNYTGDILMHIAMALPGLLSQHCVAAMPALFTVLVLLHRAWRDHARCNRRYGAAWSRYCKRVPSVIIPKIL
ncbi:unnamed protein product [Diatraea saccharalis]|uniref:Delta(14)-sterol reductase n=1 Tax=Diatraea saccharalis TaxID=40085 RepID=A0A9N9R266_9NEOP|nr:unnamed protein product [Diatraea saccharalis]